MYHAVARQHECQPVLPDMQGESARRAGGVLHVLARVLVPEAQRMERVARWQATVQAVADESILS